MQSGNRENDVDYIDNKLSTISELLCVIFLIVCLYYTKDLLS